MLASSVRDLTETRLGARRMEDAEGDFLRVKVVVDLPVDRREGWEPFRGPSGLKVRDCDLGVTTCTRTRGATGVVTITRIWARSAVRMRNLVSSIVGVPELNYRR